MCVEWYPCSGNRKIVAVGLVCLLFVVALLQTVGGRRPVVGRWSLKRRLLVRWFVGSLVRWFVGSLVRWFVVVTERGVSFVCSLVRSIVQRKGPLRTAV